MNGSCPYTYYFRMFGGREVLNFMHYVLVSDNLMVQLLYFGKKAPSTHWISNRTTSYMRLCEQLNWILTVHSEPTELSYPCIEIISNVYTHCSQKAAIQLWILHYDNVILFFNIVFSEIRFNPEVSQNSSFLPFHNTSYKSFKILCGLKNHAVCTSYTHARKCGFWHQHWHILWAVTTERCQQGKDGIDITSLF
jgi:hypothetical protein